MAQLEDLIIQKPTEALGYSWAANQMLYGARALFEAEPFPLLAFTLLCGHGMECALKALLSQRGMSQKELSKGKYGHDLAALWSSAIATREEPMPAWVDQLNRVYSAPYKLRYPLGFNGLALPNSQSLLEGLEVLLRIVFEEVK
jgi:hypothetical protein